MDIVVNSKGVQNAAFTLILALAGITALLVVPHYLAPKPQTGPAIPPDAMAAVDGVTAFYTLDYTEPPNLWPLRVCTYATEKGCEAIREFFAPSVQAAVDQYRVQTYAMVEPVQVMVDAGDRRIWKLEVTLTNPWSEDTLGTQNVYAEVEKEGGKWLLSRVLFEQEIAQFLTPTP